MDRVSIEGLRIAATIGILDWEQDILQPLVIDLEMAWDNAVPAESKRIEDALDYSAVSTAVIALVQSQSWGLIEDVAEQVADLIMTTFAVPGLRIRVAKPTAVEDANTVAVTAIRGQFV